MATTRRPVRVRVNALAHAKLLRALLEGPATVHDLAEESGLTAWTVSRHLDAFLAERLVHVSGWQQDALGRDTTEIYTWGKGKNVPRKIPSNAENCARWRARRKQRELLRRMAGQLKEAA